MIAGIDASSRAIDVVLLADDTDDALWFKYELHGATPFERARSLHDCFPTRSWWEDFGVYLIGYEDPRGHYAHTQKALGLALGAVAALLPPEMAVVPTQTQEWKRHATGNPNASKQTVRAAVVALYPPAEAWDDLNATDAYAVAWTVRALNNQALERGAA